MHKLVNFSHLYNSGTLCLFLTVFYDLAKKIQNFSEKNHFCFKWRSILVVHRDVTSHFILFSEDRYLICKISSRNIFQKQRSLIDEILSYRISKKHFERKTRNYLFNDIINLHAVGMAVERPYGFEIDFVWNAISAFFVIILKFVFNPFLKSQLVKKSLWRQEISFLNAFNQYFSWSHLA